MSILIFFLVLFLLILVHEWGHFIVAKKTGMRVDEFGIGFPPKLFGIRKGETEYTFNALPIGGFVRIWGENMEDKLPAEADGADIEKADVTTADAHRAFSARPKWAQALVLIAGVTMNVLFAWFLFVIAFMVGVQTPVSAEVATDEAELVVANVLPESPAAVLPVGAEITAAASGSNTLEALTPDAFLAFVTENNSALIVLTYKTADAVAVATVTPQTGLLETEPERAIVGVSLVLVDTVSQPFGQALLSATGATANGVVGIFTGLMQLLGDSVTGEADFSQVAGPVGIVGMVDDAASYGIVALMTFTAIISLNLAVINMLPVPALDGGRLVFVAIEAATGRAIPAIWAARVNLIGFALLMLLMIVVTYSDIMKLLS